MSGFTKGPWEFNYADGSIKSGVNYIATVEVKDWHKLGMGEANAHLIAAAPDLYEALENLIESTDPGQYHHWMKVGLATLSKARGEQNE